MAEREGFEPSRGVTLYTISSRAPSTTRTSLRNDLRGPTRRVCRSLGGNPIRYALEFRLASFSTPALRSASETMSYLSKTNLVLKPACVRRSCVDREAPYRARPQQGKPSSTARGIALAGVRAREGRDAVWYMRKALIMSTCRT